jgi:hypothetical protein
MDVLAPVTKYTLSARFRHFERAVEERQLLQVVNDTSGLGVDHGPAFFM